jgi:hypothetical protein
MRVVVQSLFLLFYLSSSYVTGQHRVSYFIRLLQHSAEQSNDQSFQASSKEQVHYTKFREATKKALDFHFGTATLELFSQVSDRHRTPQTVLNEFRIDLETSHCRAPPVLRTIEQIENPSGSGLDGV